MNSSLRKTHVSYVDIIPFCCYLSVGDVRVTYISVIEVFFNASAVSSAQYKFKPGSAGKEANVIKMYCYSKFTTDIDAS